MDIFGRYIVNIEIYYCAPWGFESQAVSLADELRKTLGIEVKLIQGDDGIFDVILDKLRIFSRSETGRFPESGEIINKLNL